MPDRTVSVLRTHDDRLIPVAGVYEIDGAHTRSSSSAAI